MTADSIQAAVQRASRARLVRFVAFADRRRQAWMRPVDQDSDAELRASAFVLADHWRVVRRENRLWREHYERHSIRQASAA